MPDGIKAAMFDLGRVVIDFDHTIAARRIAPYTTRSPEEIYALFFDSRVTGLFEEGKVSPRTFYDQVRQTLGAEIEYHAFKAIWNEIFSFTPRNKSVYDIARALKSRMTTALLSNVNELHFEYIKRTFPILDAFHRIMTSYSMGVRKPDPLIYRKALSLLGVRPEHCFYTDDRPELIERARSLGIRAHVFTDSDALRRDLASEGVIVDADTAVPHNP